jgi:hypothetical protein
MARHGSAHEIGKTSSKSIPSGPKEQVKGKNGPGNHFTMDPEEIACKRGLKIADCVCASAEIVLMVACK